MTSVVTSNNLLTRDDRAPAPALREDGTNFPWRMFFDNSQRIVDADTPAELLDYLIRDYTLLSPEEQDAARVSLAKRVQILARSAILGNLTPEQAEKIEDWEWDVLNYGDEINGDPFGWGDGSKQVGSEQTPEVADEWNIDVPLVLLNISYSPYTEVLAPLSSEGDFAEVKNIIWLRPDNEEDFLYSLSRIGYVTFGTPTATRNGE